ncbi:methionine--tRNA ligase [Chloropicon primus]|uniref:methionine--tRNA ligase n=2 Tax=Chloropicon primus TaxID=1764295 RepID=A0A5B8MGT6_9CHLO|nr:methionine--tRNA ligase [Chloropicon primus]UPQ99109.1 methionine--tRNA ligase [Chloropicon primus]|eukprot:QDZ19898.1 methionine--tRNA ligase [Chloropicon primus]
MATRLTIGDARSEEGLLKIARALKDGTYLNGTREPSRDDVVVYSHVCLAEARDLLKGKDEADNFFGWYRSVESLLGGKFDGEFEGVTILPREPLPPAPRRVAGAGDFARIVEPGTDEGEAWPPLPSETTRNVLITSALPYVNNEPHLGNIIGCVLSADVYARFCRARGYNTLFVCGTDEYGTATETKAFQEKMTCQEICDKYHALHSKIYKWFGILFDEFGRTSTNRQTRVAQEIFNQVHSNGKIHEESMEQLYSEALGRFLADRLVEGTCPKCGYEDARGDQCDNCGSLLSTTELIKPRCKLTGTEPKMETTNHLFLNLTEVEQRLQDWIDWRGKGKGEESESQKKKSGMWSANCQRVTDTWMKEGLRPRCITRDLKWGTPVPLEGFTNKVFYVWFDAPIGYISITASLFAKRMQNQKHGAPTTIGEGENDDEESCYGENAAWRQWWQAGDSEQATNGSKKPKVELIQFMGKDNIPFHTIMFPSTLIGTSKTPEENPWTLMKSISVTEYLTYEGDKFSKSRSRGVFGSDAEATGIPADVWRYSLLSSRPEASDADFKWQDLANRCNGELLANLGNFVNRTLSFAHARFNGHFPSLEDMWGPDAAEQKKDSDPAENKYDDELGEAVQPLVKKYIEAMEKMQMREAIRLILACSKAGNQFFQEKEPWVLMKDESTRCLCARVIASCVGLVRIVACLMQPFMPTTTARILKQMKLPQTSYAIDAQLLLGARYPSRLVPLNTHIDKPEVLFEAISEDKMKEMKEKFAGAESKDGDAAAKKKADKKKKAAEKKAAGKPKPPTNTNIDVSRLDLVVGRLAKVWRHPNADSLYVEEIDLGEAKGGVRQVVSGLVGKIPLEEKVGSHVVVVANMKPSKMRGESSQAMVLAAFDKNDASKVELVMPPEGSKAGDKVFANGFDGEADEQLNPKKKVFDQVQPNFSTSDACVVTYSGVALQTSSGNCTVQTLKGAGVK